MEALRQAAASNCNGRWWVKADACDVRQGLRESVDGQWAGDEDHGDGYVQELYRHYKADCLYIRDITAPTRLQHTANELQKLKTLVENQTAYLSSGATKARRSYNKVLEASRPSERTLMELSWDQTGFKDLQKQNQELLQQIELCVMNNHVCGQEKAVTAMLTKLRDKLLTYVKGCYSNRNAATHLMIFMISDELRNIKPYAINDVFRTLYCSQ